MFMIRQKQKFHLTYVLQVYDADTNNTDISVLFTAPTDGIITGLMDGDTCIRYVSDPGFYGNDTVVVFVCDDAMPIACDTVTLIITVNPALRVTADFDSIYCSKNISISVYENDTLPKGLDTTFSILTPPNYGAAQFNVITQQLEYVKANSFHDELISYQVCVDIGTDTLCDDATITIHSNCRVIDIPTAITPNGDGYNDQLVIDNLEKYYHRSIQIYNRWGNLVYKAAEYNNEWYGQLSEKGAVTSEDMIVPDGVYFFVLDYGDAESEITSVNGYIHVLR